MVVSITLAYMYLFVFFFLRCLLVWIIGNLENDFSENCVTHGRNTRARQRHVPLASAIWGWKQNDKLTPWHPLKVSKLTAKRWMWQFPCLWKPRNLAYASCSTARPSRKMTLQMDQKSQTLQSVWFHSETNSWFQWRAPKETSATENLFLWAEAD